MGVSPCSLCFIYFFRLNNVPDKTTMVFDTRSTAISKIVDSELSVYMFVVNDTATPAYRHEAMIVVGSEVLQGNAYRGEGSCPLPYVTSDPTLFDSSIFQQYIVLVSRQNNLPNSINQIHGDNTMYTIKHTRIIENYIELVKAGLEKTMAKIVARKLAAKVILDVAYSDIGIHLNIWDNEAKAEKAVVFKFIA